MVERIQNRVIAYTVLNNLTSSTPAELARVNRAFSTSAQQFSDHVNRVATARVEAQEDTTLAHLLDPAFVSELQRHPDVPAHEKILHFISWVQNTHPNSDQLRSAKLHLIQDLMHTQRNWVSDTLQITAATARTLGGVLMTGNSFSSEWEGFNQQAFESALFHLDSECESWVNRMGYLARGYRSEFNQAGEEASMNDAALSLIRDLAREELRQSSASRHPLEHDYYSQLLNEEIPEVSGTQQLASTLRSHSVLFARSSTEAATGIFGALASVGSLRIAQALTQQKFAQTVWGAAFNGFLQVALQTSAHRGIASIVSKEFATQASQAFITGAACGVSGSLVNAGFGRLLGNAALSTTTTTGEKVFRWVTARLFQRGFTFAADIETEVRMDAAMSGLSGRRNIHNRLAMGDQVETTWLWDRLVNSAGELGGDATTHAYTQSAQSLHVYATLSLQNYVPQIREGLNQFINDGFKGPPSIGQLAFEGVGLERIPEPAFNKNNGENIESTLTFSKNASEIVRAFQTERGTEVHKENFVYESEKGERLHLLFEGEAYYGVVNKLNEIIALLDLFPKAKKEKQFQTLHNILTSSEIIFQNPQLLHDFLNHLLIIFKKKEMIGLNATSSFIIRYEKRKMSEELDYLRGLTSVSCFAQQRLTALQELCLEKQHRFIWDIYRSFIKGQIEIIKAASELKELIDRRLDGERYRQMHLILEPLIGLKFAMNEGGTKKGHQYLRQAIEKLCELCPNLPKLKSPYLEVIRAEIVLARNRVRVFFDTRTITDAEVNLRVYQEQEGIREFFPLIVEGIRRESTQFRDLSLQEFTLAIESFCLKERIALGSFVFVLISEADATIIGHYVSEPSYKIRKFRLQRVAWFRIDPVTRKKKEMKRLVFEAI